MNMKLGVVAREFPPALGGMEKHAFELVRSLSRFCDIAVYTSADHADHTYDLGLPVQAVLERDIWADMPKLRSAGVDAFLVLNSGYAPLSYLQDVPVFSYCHGNDYLSPWILSLMDHERLMIGMLEKTPYLRRHGARIQRAILRRRVSRGLKHSAHIFVNSSYTKDRLETEYPGLGRPISVAPPGVSDDFFDRGSAPAATGGGSAPYRFLTVARLSSVARKKNVDNILRALSLLTDEIPFEYRIIGDGDLRERLESLAGELGLRDRVAFLGEQDSGTVIRCLDASDLFILPSRATRWDVESFGIVYVEAAARGVPSLMSRAGGATDAVADGVSGIIIESSDPQSIADGIRRFADGRDRFTPERIVSHAARFHWDNVGKDMWSIISRGVKDANIAPARAYRPPAAEAPGTVDLAGGRR